MILREQYYHYETQQDLTKSMKTHVKWELKNAYISESNNFQRKFFQAVMRPGQANKMAQFVTNRWWAQKPPLLTLLLYFNDVEWYLLGPLDDKVKLKYIHMELEYGNTE